MGDPGLTRTDLEVAAIRADLDVFGVAVGEVVEHAGAGALVRLSPEYLTWDREHRSWSYNGEPIAYNGEPIAPGNGRLVLFGVDDGVGDPRLAPLRWLGRPSIYPSSFPRRPLNHWRRGRLVPTTVRRVTVVDELREESAGAAMVPGSIRRVERLYDIEGVPFVWPLLGRLWEPGPFDSEAVACHPDGSLWLVSCRLPDPPPSAPFWGRLVRSPLPKPRPFPFLSPSFEGAK